MTERIVVPFEGDGSGVGELTWGQNELWLAMQREGSSISIGGAFPLPEGTTVAGIAADLRFLMSRHQALRTRLTFDADGHPWQEVAKSGTALLEVVDAGDADPGEIAAALHTRYDEKAFDYANEWPIRWAVIVSHGTPTHMVSVISHLAADGRGILTMLDDLASRDPATGLAKGPVTAMQPLDLARLQATPAVIRQGETALRHWERLLRVVPARGFAGSADKRQQLRYWQAFYDSPASSLAVQAIAARTRVDSSTVLLAAWAVAVARVTGSNPVAIQAVADNRFRPGFAGVVSPVTHFGLCVIDVADITFDAAIARAWRSAMKAYKLSYCDPAKRAELVTRVSQERGEQIDIRCFVNDRRLQNRQEPEGQPPDPAQVRAALPRSALTWGFKKEMPENERCYLHINDVPDTVCCELRVDTHYVSPAEMEGCLRGLEAVVVEAALDPAAPTGVRAGARSALVHP